MCGPDLQAGSSNCASSLVWQQGLEQGGGWGWRNCIERTEVERGAEHVARRGRTEMLRLLVVERKGSQLKDVGVDRKAILKRILE